MKLPTIKGNPFHPFNIMIRIQNGENIEDIEKEMIKVGKRRAKQEGKTWGQCGSCDEETVLVEEANLCGPCCFGEAETINGNF